MKLPGVLACLWTDVFAWAMVLGLGSGFITSANAQLTTALQVRSLTPSQAGEGREVRLRAVVIYNDSPGTVFVQDATAGTFFRPNKVVSLQHGDEVEIHGYTQSALYVPGIERATFRVVGKAAHPPAREVHYADLASGRFHYQWVAVEGIVRSIVPVDDGRAMLRLHDGTHLVEILVGASINGTNVQVDSRVRARGLASGRINLRRQLVRPYLQSAGWQDVDELEPAPSREDMQVVTTAELLTVDGAGHPGRRVRLRGTVLAAFADGMVFLRDEKGATVAKLNDSPDVELGDLVEVEGFLGMGRFSASLVDAELRTRQPGEAPHVIETTVPLLFERGLDCELVTVTAVVVDWIRDNDGVVVILRKDGKTVRAVLPGAMSGPEAGAEVRVTGVCQVESTDVQPYRSIPAEVSLRLRTPEDVVVIRSPPWWTARRMKLAAAIFMSLGVIGACWIFLLRRQVRRQTEVLRHKIERESALDERQRLAREFHDTLEQDLTGVSLQLSTASARSFDEKGRDMVEASRKLIARIQRETRILVGDLRETDPVSMGVVDLVTVLHGIAEERVVEQWPRLEVAGPPGVLFAPSSVAYHLRMMVQESITNVLKHAEAKVIQLCLDPFEDGLRLRVIDDGKGFDPAREVFGKRGHFGCMGIRERCTKLGGTVFWHSAPGEGTTVEIVLKHPNTANLPS